MVYLIHFDQKFHHAQHYLGFVKGSNMENLERRLQEHRTNAGARLLRALNLAGIGWQIAKVWLDLDGNDERKLKNQKNSSRWCPICGGRNCNKPLKFKK